jgi:hypothetical protein
MDALGVGFALAALAAAAGFLAGRRSARARSGESSAELKRLEEYDFCPFVVTPEGQDRMSRKRTPDAGRR